MTRPTSDAELNAALDVPPEGAPSVAVLLPPSSVRLDWVDAARGIGILLVVLGHVLIGLNSRHLVANSAVVKAWVDGIYSFHMPLFFFLAGLFAERAVARPWSGYLTESLTKIVYPYFLWSSIQELLRNAAGQANTSVSQLWRIVSQPPMQFWFLYALFTISLLYQVLRRIGLPKIVIFLLAAGLCVAPAMHIRLGPWGIPYLIAPYAVFFAGGVLFTSSGCRDRWHDLLSPPWMFAVWQAGMACVVVGVAMGWSDLPLYRPVGAIAGIFATVALSVFLSGLGDRTLRTWGQRSLVIYLVHTIASAGVRILLDRQLHWTSSALNILLGTVAGIYVPMALYAVSRRYGFAWLLGFPTERRSRLVPHLRPSRPELAGGERDP